jgi:hypothetical protein
MLAALAQEFAAVLLDVANEIGALHAAGSENGSRMTS